jgi:hypothetical protein
VPYNIESAMTAEQIKLREGLEPTLIANEMRAVEGVWSAHWRKPLSLAEVNQMADTPEVRQHRGERQRGRASSPDLNSSGTLIELRKLLLRNDNSCWTTGNYACRVRSQVAEQG